MAQYRKQFEQSVADFVEPAEKQAFSWAQFADGNTVKKTEVVLDDEEDTFEQGWQKGLAMLKKEKGL